MINSYNDILEMISQTDRKAPHFEVDATIEQSASEIIVHLANALRSGKCPEGLYLDLTQKADRESLRKHARVMEHLLSSGFNPMAPHGGFGFNPGMMLSYTPRPVIELNGKDIKLLIEALQEQPQKVTIDLKTYHDPLRGVLRAIVDALRTHPMPKGLNLQLYNEDIESICKMLLRTIKHDDPQGSFNALYGLQALAPESETARMGVIEYSMGLFIKNLSVKTLSDILKHFQHEKIREAFKKEFEDLIDLVLCEEISPHDQIKRCQNLILVMDKFWPGKLELEPNKYFEKFQRQLNDVIKKGSKKEADTLWNDFLAKNELLRSPVSDSYLWQTLLTGFIEVYEKVDPKSPNLQEALKIQASASHLPEHPLDEPKSPGLRRK